MLITIAIECVFKPGSLVLPTLFFFFTIVLAVLVPLPFHMNCKITFSVSIVSAKTLVQVFPYSVTKKKTPHKLNELFGHPIHNSC